MSSILSYWCILILFYIFDYSGISNYFSYEAGVILCYLMLRRCRLIAAASSSAVLFSFDDFPIFD